MLCAPHPSGIPHRHFAHIENGKTTTFGVEACNLSIVANRHEMDRKEKEICYFWASYILKQLNNEETENQKLACEDTGKDSTADTAGENCGRDVVTRCPVTRRPPCQFIQFVRLENLVPSSWLPSRPSSFQRASSDHRESAISASGVGG